MENNLEYISQSNDSYTIKIESGKLLRIVKAYTSHSNTTRMHYNFHENWMWVAIIGLPIGGLSTIIFAPLIFGKNFNLLKNENLTEEDRIHAKHFMIISSILFLVGLALFVLFIMHLVY